MDKPLRAILAEPIEAIETCLRRAGMKLDLTLTEHFDVPLDDVWRAITDSRLLAQWLMENDFEPRTGARFRLWHVDPSPGWRGWVDCEVIELRQPTRMIWSWSDGTDESSATRVIFELSVEGNGTRLTLRHIGETGMRWQK